MGSEKFDLATLDNLMQNADVYMTALGATRIKRDAGYDKEFSFNKKGLNVGIAYRGASDQAGKVYFEVKDVSRYLFLVLVTNHDHFTKHDIFLFVHI